jgi:hypothetical protein
MMLWVGEFFRGTIEVTEPRYGIRWRPSRGGPTLPDSLLRNNISDQPRPITKVQR